MIDFKKPVQTKDGEKVRIYCTDALGDYPVHGAIIRGSTSTPYSWTLGGLFCKTNPGSDFDLVNVPEEKFCYVNIYVGDETPLHMGYPHETRADADKAADHPIPGGKRVGCIKVKLERRFDE